MARLSLRLPDTLHHRLSTQARREGVSLNQFLVFLLAERSRPVYSILPADKTAEEQRASFARLRQELGSTSDEEVWKILDEREPAPSEAADIGWTPELRQALEKRIEAARRSVLES
jgi:HicB family